MKIETLQMKSNPTSLYVHIPFCRNICTYCDFKKFIYNQNRINDYFQSLFFDLSRYENRTYKTIYIGGGTPSCIDKTNLSTLLDKLKNKLDKNYKEFTIECNVEDINDEFLSLIKEKGINRLSIGVQTFNDKFISFCNRKHTKEMAINNIIKASKYINNISIDLIYAFPNQTLKDLKEDIEIATSLPIKHISYYSLLIEENTVLYAKNIKDVDDRLQAKMYKLIYNNLKEKGFNRYEFSNFAKNKKYQSYHNKVYWENKHYDAIGLAGSGYVDNIRYTNNINIIKYNQKDYTLSEKTILSKADIMFDQIMLNLRMDEGLNIVKFNKKYKTDFIITYKKQLEELKKLKLITIKNNVLKTTFKGSLLLNDVLQYFLDE